jgi:hypothetical protein
MRAIALLRTGVAGMIAMRDHRSRDGVEGGIGIEIEIVFR